MKTVREREVKGIGLIPCRSALALPLRWVIVSITKILDDKAKSQNLVDVPWFHSRGVQRFEYCFIRLFYLFSGAAIYTWSSIEGGGGGLLQLNCGRMEVTATMQLGAFGFIAGSWGKSPCFNSFLLQWRKNATLVCAWKDILFITGLGHSGQNSMD